MVSIYRNALFAIVIQESACGTASCDECSGRGHYTVGRPNDPSAELFVCEACDGTGDAMCCECDDGTPATALRHVDCRPPLAMPLCARHAAEYAEELV